MPKLRRICLVGRGARWFRAPLVVVAAALLAATTGCGKSDPFGRQPVEGFVTLEGQPIRIGSIVFEPAEKQPAGAMASIRDGAFSIPRQAGPCVGKYSVWLHAYDHDGENLNMPAPKEMLPSKFLSKPPAEVTISEVDDKNPNKVTIDLR